VLCWNVRGLNSEGGNVKSEQKLMRVNVTLFACKRQNVSLLIGD
jgi:hypothetical protein